MSGRTSASGVLAGVQRWGGQKLVIWSHIIRLSTTPLPWTIRQSSPNSGGGTWRLVLSGIAVVTGRVTGVLPSGWSEGDRPVPYAYDKVRSRAGDKQPR